tara:strand:- start:409 stop:837 length:429 start_codon:yes stop_codon:yes gene_type:complete
MLRVSRLTDYAVLVLCHLASKPGVLVSAKQVSDATSITETTSSKILKLLNKSKIISSTRGAKGGYCLEKKLDAVSIIDVIAAIDGSPSVTMCCEENQGNCDLESLCSSKQGWNKVNKALLSTLSSFTLADFITFEEKIAHAG